MTEFTTPSQLKKELENNKIDLLKACLSAFNELPNQRLTNMHPSTYALAANIERLLKLESQ